MTGFAYRPYALRQLGMFTLDGRRMKRFAQLAARRLQRGGGPRESIVALEADFREAFVEFRWGGAKRMAVGIPALVVVGYGIYQGRDSLPWHYPAPDLCFSLEFWIRGLLVYAIGAGLAWWFYRRRDGVARRSGIAGIPRRKPVSRS
jgi:hypothetical protein